MTGTPRFGRRLISDSAIYGVGGVANQALNIILVPIYARALGPDRYGVISVVNATLSLSIMIATLALPQAFFRWYLKEAETDPDRLNVLRSSMSLRLIVSTAFAMLIVAGSFVLQAILLGDADNALLLLALVGPIVLFDTLNQMPLAYLRAHRRPGPYAILGFSRAIVGSLLIIVFVLPLRLGVLGVVLGSLGSAALTTSAGLLVLLRAGALTVGWNPPLVRSMLAFSLPLVPASVAGWTLNLSDRYVVRAFEGFGAAGLYSAGYTAGQVVNALAIAPFTLAWGAAFWDLTRQEGGQRSISRVLTLFAVTASAAALFLSAFGTDAIRLLLGARFEASRYVVPFSAFAYVLYGMFTIGSTGLSIVGRTRLVLVAMGLAAVANLGANLILVPAFGFMGAAFSTLGGYALLAVVGSWLSQRQYPVPWDLRRAVSALVIGFVLGEAAVLGPDMLAWRLLCFAAYLPTLLALRVIGRNEMARIAAEGRRIAARLRGTN